MNHLTASQFIAQGTTPAAIASIAAYGGNGKLRAIADEVAMATGMPGGYVRRHRENVERAARRYEKRQAAEEYDRRHFTQAGKPRNRRAA